MPIYEYICTACGGKLEIIQSFSEKAKRKCGECGELKLKKIISMNAFHLKGGGWYKEGYNSTRKNGKPDKTETGSETGSKTETAKEKKIGGKETKKKTKGEGKKPTTAS